MSDAKPSFGAELERLEAIVRELENSDIDLDRALELFEEGVGRLKGARKLLRESELTVKRVLEESDGAISTDDLDG
jgi:exodeoxyribonuclease VII small subunit